MLLIVLMRFSMNLTNQRNNMADIEAAVTGIIACNMMIEADGVTDDKALVNDLGCDSMDIAEITVEIETRYHIDLDDVDYTDTTTVGELIEEVKKRIK